MPRKLTREEFVEKAKAVHGDRYDYSETEYVDSITKVKIICPVHGIFLLRPADHVNKGYGCKLCSIKEFSEKRKLSREEIIERSNRIHGNRYDYSKFEYAGYDKKSIIICPEHGEFLQTPHHHLAGQGCPYCQKSIGENRVKRFLEENGYDYIPQKSFETCRNPKTGRKLFFDFWIKGSKIVIEFQGEQHYGYRGYFSEEDTKEIQFRDSLKRNWCRDNGFKEIEISYKELKKIDNILREELR